MAKLKIILVYTEVLDMGLNKTWFFFFVVLVLTQISLLSACSSGSSSSTTVSPTPTPAPTPTPTYTDVKRIVTTGAGLNFNGSTGSWSEMNIDPVSHAPDVVYYDRTTTVSPVAGALKYGHMTSTGAWVVEVVDANAPVTLPTNTCGGGATSAACIGAPNVAVPTSPFQIYDIKHLVTSGVSTPVIAYVYGTGGASSSTTGKSVRLAVRNSSGVWAIETAVTGAQILSATVGSVGPQLATLEYPIKGLRLLVDDSNRIHLVFGVYAATANNSVYMYTMRNADGTWITPTVVSSSAPSALAFVSGAPTYAAGVGVHQTGAVWCKYNSGGTSADATGILISLATMDNTPAASTQGFLLKCATANADGSCATWQGLDFAAGCSGPCVSTTPASSAAAVSQANRSDIAIDPATGNIFLSYFSALPSLTSPAVIATGILSTLSPQACSSGLSASAWSTVRAYPTAAQGTLGLRVAADGTNLYLASLVAATGTSLILNKITSSLGANWNTSPDQVTVESTTNTVGGGFAFDSTSGALWGSYGALTAAAAGVIGQDIKVFGAYPSDIDATAGIVNYWAIDQTNFVAQSTAVPMLDAAVAPNGNVGYVYFYQEPGTAGPNSHLYYGIRGGASVLQPVFGEKIVSNAIGGTGAFMNGLHPSLAYDSTSNPAIAFLDQGVAANAGYLMVARSSNGGVSFDLDRVDGSAANTKNVGQYTSIAVTSQDTIGVAYYDFSAGGTTGQRLKFAKRTKNGAWLRYVVDGPGSTGTGCNPAVSSSTGLYANFKWTSAGKPVIVYQGVSSGVKSLKLAFAQESQSSLTYTWTCLTIDTDSQGFNVRGEGIDFYLTSADLPYIAHYDSGVGALRVVSCPSGSDVITCATTGASAFSGERLNYLVGAVTAIASRPGIVVDSAGKVTVSFHSAGDLGLFIAAKTAGTSGGWSSSDEAIEASPLNVGSTYTGHHGVLLLNSGSQPMLFFRSFENWIKYFSRETN